MARTAPKDSLPLTANFHYENGTHSYDIKWASLGRPELPPIVFVHGTPWSSRVWEPFAVALSRTYHVYLFDNPGFGESPLEQILPARSFEPASELEKLDADLARQSEVFAALYHDWRKSWGDQKAHVIAHDHGGLMSLRARLLHDCQYASLCLIDVVAIGPFGNPLFKATAEDPGRSGRLTDAEFEDILESYIRDAAFHKLPTDTLQALKAPWLREGGKQGFIRQLCQANYRSTDQVEPHYPDLGQRLPIKIIWGADDGWIPVETAEKLRSALNAHEVVVITRAGHLVMYDQPGQLGIELGIWLQSLDFN